MCKSYERFVLALCVVIVLLWSALLANWDEQAKLKRGRTTSESK